MIRPRWDASLKNPGREMEIWSQKSTPFTRGLKLLSTPGPAHSLSDLPWQRKLWGDHQQHRALREHWFWELLLRPVQEPGEGFRKQCVGGGGVGVVVVVVGVLRLWDSPWRGCWGPGVSVLTPALPHPILQLLKKIKRCERKGTESVTEEKCAVLFTTSFILGPNKLPVQLQVNQGPSPAQSGTPVPLHATHWGPQSPYLHDYLIPSVFVTHSRMHGEEQGHGVHIP